MQSDMTRWFRRTASQITTWPGSLFSAIRDAKRSARYTRKWIRPCLPSKPDALQYVPAGVIGNRGISLHPEEQLAKLALWKSESYQRLFTALRNDPSINTQRLGQAALHNGYYPTPDAEIYAAMILERKPGRIVEVGSGYSTLVARTAVRYAGCNTRIVVIDPSPRTDVHAAADEVILRPVEEAGLTDFDWTSGDLLFIDSSHICRTRGDLPCLYCQVLPALPAGVLVHVHDIFLPFDYPNVYDDRCYTEQYLLHCLLAHSQRYHTVLATHWLAREHGDQLKAVFGDAVARDPLFFGASYWFEIRTDAPEH